MNQKKKEQGRTWEGEGKRTKMELDEVWEGERALICRCESKSLLHFSLKDKSWQSNCACRPEGTICFFKLSKKSCSLKTSRHFLFTTCNFRKNKTEKRGGGGDDQLKRTNPMALRSLIPPTTHKPSILVFFSSFTPARRTRIHSVWTRTQHWKLHFSWLNPGTGF